MTFLVTGTLKRGHRDSNSGQPALQADTLPLSYNPSSASSATIDRTQSIPAHTGPGVWVCTVLAQHVQQSRGLQQLCCWLVFKPLPSWMDAATDQPALFDDTGIHNNQVKCLRGEWHVTTHPLDIFEWWVIHNAPDPFMIEEFGTPMMKHVCGILWCCEESGAMPMNH